MLRGDRTLGGVLDELFSLACFLDGASRPDGDREERVTGDLERELVGDPCRGDLWGLLRDDL